VTAPSPPTLDQMLCFALYGAANRVTRLYRPVLERLGLTYPQYLAMLVLWERSPRAVGEIGAALDMETGTLTPLLKRMEAAGLISRTRDTVDERRVFVALTEAGEALRLPGASVTGEVLCRVPLPIDELIDLRERLRRLIDNIDDAR